MKKKTKVFVGMDVHKDSVMIAVLPEGAREPTLVKRLSHDPRGLRRLLDRLGREQFMPATRRAVRATCSSGRFAVGVTSARSLHRR